MKKKKKKKKSKKKSSLAQYKVFTIVGGIFHLIVYLLYDTTFYNTTLFFLSVLLCGTVLGIYFIRKMDMLNPKSYRKIKGTKLRLYMFFVCFLMILGASLIFGNVINGTILGLNYLGKTDQTVTQTYSVQKFGRYSSGGRKRVRRNKLKVYFERNGETMSLILPENYIASKSYDQFQKIEMKISKGLFGYDIMTAYTLKK